MRHKVIVLGSGPAGLTAAIYLARADLAPLVLAGKEPGGQLMWTTLVENFPGFPDGIQGPDLMKAMRQQAVKFGAQIIDTLATGVDLSNRPLKIITEDKAYEVDSVIVATGASSKMLGIPGEQEHMGKGVSTCATCDAPFFKDKEVMVVGGGDAAMEDALVLTKFALKVTVLVRANGFEQMKASQIMQDRAKENEKITFMFNTEVIAISGEPLVQSVRIINNQKQEERDFNTQGVFVAIGHKPNTEFLGDALKTEGPGYISSGDGVHTSVEGVFVAGDVQDYKYRQAITASGMGCVAALEAERFLEQNRI